MCSNTYFSLSLTFFQRCILGRLLKLSRYVIKLASVAENQPHFFIFLQYEDGVCRLSAEYA